MIAKEKWTVYKCCAATEICVIPKVFPYGRFVECMKFTQKTLLETVRCKNNGWTTYQARKIAHVGV
ncbi:MAG: hypothetical protein V1866_07095, partial [archaeon]